MQFCEQFPSCAREYHEKLQAIAIIPNRRCWIFIARIFPSQCMVDFRGGRVQHAL